MTQRTFWILLIVTAVAAFAGWRVAQRRAGAGRPDPRAGAPLLAFDVNDVAAIRIRAGTDAVDVVRNGGHWVVASLYAYPADYDRLAQRLLELADLKLGQIVPGGTEDLAEFGLDEEGATGLVHFEAANGRPLGRLTLGKTREGRGGPSGGFPDGQYVRVDDGPVALLGRVVGGFDGESRDWIKTELLGVVPTAGSMVEVSVAGETHRLRYGSEGAIELEGLGADEALDEGMARRVVNALQYLNFQTIADPELGAENLGFTAPDRYTLHTAQGLVYSILLGGAAPDGGRYARVGVAYERPAPAPAPEVAPSEETTDAPASADDDAVADSKPDDTDDAAERDARKASEENERLARWTYVLSTWAAESLVLPRGKLILVPPPATPAEGTASSALPDEAPPAPPSE